MSINGQGGSIEIAPQYDKFRLGYTEPFKANGRVNVVTQPNDGDTVTVGSIVYTFKTTPAAANDVLIGTAKRDSIINLSRAMRGEEDYVGTSFYAGTDPIVIADAELALGADVIFLKAYIYGQAGHSLTLSASAGARVTVTAFSGGVNGGEAIQAQARVSWAANLADGDTLTIGGIAYRFKTTMAAINDIQLGSDTDNTIASLVRVLNGTGTVAVDYYTGTTTPATSVSATRAFNTVVLSARTAGVAGNSLTLVKTVDSTSVMNITGATFAGGKELAAYDRSRLTWRPLRATMVNYGYQQQQGELPPTVGSTLTSYGVYKGMVAAGGSISFLPTLEEDIGWLLYGSLGASSTVDAGAYGVHTFTFAANESQIPWMAIRKKIPGKGNFPPQGMNGFDNLIRQFAFSIQSGAPLEANMEVMGLFAELDSHPEVWTSEGYENFQTVPIASNAEIRIPTVQNTAFSATQAAIALQNNLSGPREEGQIGSYYMDDLTVLNRSLTIRMMLKWQSPDLYQRGFGGLGQSTWSPQPFVTEYDSVTGQYAVDILVNAPYNIAGTSTPCSLRVIANRVAWQPDGDVELRPGGTVMQAWTGTVIYDATSFCKFILTNARQTAYTWPVEPT